MSVFSCHASLIIFGLLVFVSLVFGQELIFIHLWQEAGAGFDVFVETYDLVSCHNDCGWLLGLGFAKHVLVSLNISQTVKWVDQFASELIDLKICLL